MGAAKRQTSKTTITEYEEQEMSIRVLEVLPEMLQVRANLDKDWSLQYSRDYAAGDAFPPILVYRLPDERLVVTDGFHRLDACMAIGKKTIRAQVREGTMHEALLAAIEANTAAFHRGRPFSKDDQRHAVEMMFADPDCWGWSNLWIGEVCGVTAATVHKWRAEYCEERSVPLPDKVLTRKGRLITYLRPKKGKVRGVASAGTGRGGKPKYKTTFEGQTLFLGSDLAQAEETVSRLSGARVSLDLDNLIVYFHRRGLFFHTPDLRLGPVCDLSGLWGHGVVLTSIEFKSATDIPWAIGCIKMISAARGTPTDRLVILCYRSDGPARSIDLASQAGVEFLTPNELVESLKADSLPS